MSFMRGVVENAIKNMSPEERSEALLTVSAQMVQSMSPAQRREALTAIVSMLLDGLPGSDRTLIAESIPSQNMPKEGQ